MNNKITLRMCVACREMKDKSNLIKVIKNKNNVIEIDAKQNKEGRGAYLCKSIDCYNSCVKKKSFNRAFKCNVDESLYTKLRECINNE